MTKNKDSTRYYSEKQEKEVASVIGGFVQANSGATKFAKGDIINKDSSILVECKCQLVDKTSFSIKKDWIAKNNLERKEMQLENSCIAFRFGPDQEDYFIIDKKLMKYLVDKLKEENI